MDEPVVTVKQGKLRGVIQKSVLGPSYLAFKGIPFAAPPIGELRFKDPEPAESWTGVRDATKNAVDCAPQMTLLPTQDVFGDEDCLYLNVYTTSLTESKPVMFWIHGGGFLVGTGTDTSTRPDYLIPKDVVIVSPNYRLGALGFLNLNHKVAPGNQAVKDLILALKWTKENVDKFGGDPNNVTIFGCSAGGALVHCLSVSPAAKGLFHKAIAQSGALTCPWSRAEHGPQSAFKLTSLLGKETTDPVEAVEFLRTIPYKKLIEVQSTAVANKDLYYFRFCFGINSDEAAENPVLPLPIDQLLGNSSEIPLIIGHTSHEFIMFLEEIMNKSLKSFNDRLPVHAKKLTGTEEPEEIAKIVKKVKDWYFGGEEIDEDKLPAVVDFMSDVHFRLPAIRAADDRVKRNSAPTYLYKFSYVGNEKTATHMFLKDSPITGSSHGDELSYLFYQPHCKGDNEEPPALGTRDRITLERITQMWANFAKTGNPTPSLDEYITALWTPVTEKEFNYFEIGDEMKMSVVQPHILST